MEGGSRATLLVLISVHSKPYRTLYLADYKYKYTVTLYPVHYLVESTVRRQTNGITKQKTEDDTHYNGTSSLPIIQVHSLPGSRPIILSQLPHSNTHACARTHARAAAHSTIVWCMPNICRRGASCTVASPSCSYRSCISVFVEKDTGKHRCITYCCPCFSPLQLIMQMMLPIEWPRVA